MKSTLKKVGIAVLTVGVALNCGCIFRIVRPSETIDSMTILDESQITATTETSATSTSQELMITPTPTPAPTSTPTPTPTSMPTPTPEATVTIAPTKMPTQAPTKTPTSAPTPTPTTAPEAWMETRPTSAVYDGAMQERTDNGYDSIPRNSTLDALAQARAEELAFLGEINHDNMPSAANWEGLISGGGIYGASLYRHCGDNFEATSIGIGRATYHRADGSVYTVTCMLLKR